jgi:hypothetical protein
MQQLDEVVEGIMKLMLGLTEEVVRKKYPDRRKPAQAIGNM